MTSLADQTLFQKVINQAIEKEIEIITKQKIEEAKKELDQRIPEIVAGVTVNITKMVEINTLQDRIIFTIIKNN